MPKTNHRLRWNGALTPVRTQETFKTSTVASGYFSSVVSGAAGTITALTAPTTAVATKLTIPYGSGAVAPASGMMFISGSGLYISDGGAFQVIWGA